jgi:integrase
MTDTKYLIKQFNTWIVAVTVPKRLRGVMGQTRLRATLNTSNLTEANRLKYPIVSEFLRRINEAAGRAEDPRISRVREAGEWRTAIAASSPETVGHDERHEHEPREAMSMEFLEWIKVQPEELRPLLKQKGLGEGGTLISDQIEPWIAESPDAGQTRSQHKSTLKRYIAWAGDLVTVEETDRKKAGEYVTHLLTASGLKRRTIKRHLSSLSQLWLWLDSKGIQCSNVWLGHRLGKKPKGTERKGLSDEKVLKVLNGSFTTERYRQTLKDLTRLALLHGARLDELCALRKTDIAKREDGYWIKIGDGKTDAAVREIPVHDKAVDIVERRLEGDDEFLFEGLIPGGPDDKRSWYVSKAHGRFRRQEDVKVDGRLEDFHASATRS